MNEFSNNYFFDIDKFGYKEIFTATPWETVANILPFIKQLFASQKISPNYKGRSDVYVGEGTVIHPGVEIEGPAIIGANCKIGHAAFIREGCFIGDNVHIGHAVEVKHSLILNNAMIAHLNYIGDSIIGNNVNISGGAILANFRLDKKNITIKTIDGKKIDTGLNKFCAAIGDDSVVGVNAVINPGTLLGRGVIIFPLKSVSGVHKNNATIK